MNIDSATTLWNKFNYSVQLIYPRLATLNSLQGEAPTLIHLEKISQWPTANTKVWDHGAGIDDITEE